MAGQVPALRHYIKTEDNLIPLVDEWQQAKGHFTGKIKVGENLAALFQPGAELKIISFPNKPKAKAAKAATPEVA